jgi:hypothetical protein
MGLFLRKLLQKFVNLLQVRRVAQKLNPRLHLVKPHDLRLIEAVTILEVLHEDPVVHGWDEF